MVRIYLDLETYRPKDEGAFTDERIIVVGGVKDESPFAEGSLKIEPSLTVYSEWNDGSERQILARLFSFLTEALSAHRFTVLAGFNILRFDIPLLVARSVQLGLGQVDALSKLLHNTYTLDYFQQLLPANNNLFKGMTLPTIVRVSRELGLNPPESFAQSGDIKEFYESKRYDDIVNHMMQDIKIVRWLDLFGAKRLLRSSLDRGVSLFK